MALAFFWKKFFIKNRVQCLRVFPVTKKSLSLHSVFKVFIDRYQAQGRDSRTSKQIVLYLFHVVVWKTKGKDHAFKYSFIAMIYLQLYKLNVLLLKNFVFLCKSWSFWISLRAKVWQNLQKTEYVGRNLFLSEILDFIVYKRNVLLMVY